MDSTASLITPKRFVAEPSVLCYRNPWFELNEGHVSHWLVALTKFSAILDFDENILLRTSTRHLAQCDPKQR